MKNTTGHLSKSARPEDCFIRNLVSMASWYEDHIHINKIELNIIFTE